LLRFAADEIGARELLPVERKTGMRIGISSFATKRIAAALHDGRWHRFTGRFVILRALVARLRAARDRRDPAGLDIGPSLFPQLAVETCLAGLRRDGVWQGLQLPPVMVGEIAAFARSRICSDGLHGRQRFLFAELCGGRTPGGAVAPIAEVQACEECSAVETVGRDPLLLQTATRYLGFRPRKVQRRLYWSPCGELQDTERRAGGQTIDFHYDIEPSSALYIFFYIEGGDRHSGAHVAITGSHRNKPLRLALAPAFRSEAHIFAHYPHSRERVIEGGPGFGFFEDPGCYHRALPPTRSHRLVLQLRLS
jgi:hypothetical protein